MTADNRENIVTSLLYFSCSLYSPSSDLLSLNINSMTVLQFRGHTDQQTNMMEAASAAFTVFFTLESLLKIGACGWRVGIFPSCYCCSYKKIIVKFERRFLSYLSSQPLALNGKSHYFSPFHRNLSFLYTQEDFYFVPQARCFLLSCCTFLHNVGFLLLSSNKSHC